MSQALTNAFEALKGRFKPGAIDKTLTFYFSLGDSEGQKWVMTVSPDSCEIKEGKSDTADIFLKTKEDLFIKLLNRTWSPGAMDFMRGKIKSNDPLGLKKVLENCFS